MPIRITLIACVLVSASMAVTTAFAGDPYGGFGPSGTDTQAIEVSPDTAAPQPDDQQTLPWLQPQGQDLQTNYGAAWDQQGAASQEYDMDDEGGH